MAPVMAGRAISKAHQMIQFFRFVVMLLSFLLSIRRPWSATLLFRTTVVFVGLDAKTRQQLSERRKEFVKEMSEIAGRQVSGRITL